MQKKNKTTQPAPSTSQNSGAKESKGVNPLSIGSMTFRITGVGALAIFVSGAVILRPDIYAVAWWIFIPALIGTVISLATILHGRAWSWATGAMVFLVFLPYAFGIFSPGSPVEQLLSRLLR